MRFVLLMFLLVFVACGPSSAQIKTARTARYQATPHAVFEAAIDACKENGGIDQVDEDRAVVFTKSKWYQRDGSTEGETGDGKFMVTDGSVLVSLMVEVKSDGDARWVEITPLVLEHVSGSPQPREIAPDDPSMPGWVEGKVDNLYVAIHDRLKTTALPAEPAPANP
jgi:hypothetical protein